MQPAVRVQGVVKEFADRAVDGLDFDVEEGELLVLLGPSGCGKTTTLRMIAGLEEPDAGNIWLGSRLVSSAERNLFTPTEKRNIGMVFQSYAIWPHMTVFDNVAYPLRVRRVPGRTIRQKVAETLELLGLQGLESRSATALSGGQQQRVALARAIVFEPQLLLLDEPLSNLDAKLRVHMRAELKHLHQRTGMTSIFVTHDQAESMALADRIIVMNRGRIEQVGPPDEIYQRPRSRFVSEFVGSINILPGVVAGGTNGSLTLQHEAVLIHGHALAAERVPTGAAASASIRPESLSITREATEAANLWPARVAAAAYYGDHREYDVDLGTTRLKVTTPSSLALQAGQQVFLTCDPSEVVIMPHGES